MKSTPLPSIILLPQDTDCALCDDSGFDHAEDNFCECPEGDKLLRKEMQAVPSDDIIINDDLEDPYWD